MASGFAYAVGDFQIHIDPGPELASNPAALAAFRRGAAEWESQISSPIRINISADLGTFDNAFTIGGTTGFGDSNINLEYTMVRNAMAARASRPGDAVLGFLPTIARNNANVPIGGTFDNATIGITRANQKALGVIPSDSVKDGTIIFNRNFNFAYDRSTGQQSQIDFQTVVAHEIGHVLGFLSDTDDFDNDPTLTDNSTTLDLFRFGLNSKPKTFADFQVMPRELRPGIEAVTTDLVNSYRMSTGEIGGDGRQASHWKDDQLLGTRYIGVMDPTLSTGTIEDVTAADLRVLELIGYDVIPEPSAAGAAGVIVIVCVLLRRHRRGGECN
jgi:hypothetical protein